MHKEDKWDDTDMLFGYVTDGDVTLNGEGFMAEIRDIAGSAIDSGLNALGTVSKAIGKKIKTFAISSRSRLGKVYIGVKNALSKSDGKEYKLDEDEQKELGAKYALIHRFDLGYAIEQDLVGILYGAYGAAIAVVEKAVNAKFPTTGDGRLDNAKKITEMMSATDFALNGKGAKFCIYLNGNVSKWIALGEEYLILNGRLSKQDADKVRIRDIKGSDIIDAVKHDRDNYDMGVVNEILELMELCNEVIANVDAGKYITKNEEALVSLVHKLYVIIKASDLALEYISDHINCNINTLLSLSVKHSKEDTDKRVKEVNE